MASTQLDVKVEITPENKCGFCTGSICCTYITQEIDTPRSISDFDQLLWQVAHHDVWVYKDDGAWFITVNNKCRFLGDGGQCGIYDTRPLICREHSNECCEFDGPAEDDFELFFNSYEKMLHYCRKRFKNWDKRFKRSK